MVDLREKMEQPFSIIVFDLGNVLVRIDYAAFLRTLRFDHQMTEAELYQLLEDDGRAFEMGKESAEDFLAGVNTRIGKSYTFEQLRKAWVSIIAGAIPGCSELLEQLARTYRLMMLSNTNELHFQHTMGVLPALQRFEKFFLSYQIGILKPSREIYEHVLRHVDVVARRIVFIDDLEKNVQAAKDVGMSGVVFRGVEPLISELRQLRII